MQNYISVVLPTYREKNSIRECALKFSQLDIVKEIIVVNNNAEAGTSEEVFGIKKVRVVNENIQGYGAAIKRGLKEAKMDKIAICEPDGTFEPKDILKLASYSDDKDLVLGSRTISTFIYSGANMGRFLKWGNWFVAKLVEVLFNTTYLSDVGCTFRIVSSKLAFKVLEEKTTNRGFFGLQMMLIAIKNEYSYVQIPVYYGPRVGKSASTGSITKAAVLGIEMIIEVLKRRLI
jgi:glycosyltransferase involved in cell wall biosynthesis